MHQHFSSRRRDLLVGSLAAWVSACTGWSPAPRPDSLWDAATRQPLTRELVLQRLAAADHVVLGERHDNPEHHRLQAEIIGALAGRGRRPAVVFEMLDTEQIAPLAAHLAARPNDADGLGDAVGWPASGWPDWALYKPIATAALEARLPIVAGNLNRERTRAVVRDGYAALGDDAALRRAVERPLPGDIESALLADLETAHCGHVPRDRLGPMLRVQRARDASMALAMAMHPQSVLIAGTEHGRNDRGVPRVLRDLLPGRRVVSLAFIELEAGAAPPDELPWDLVWFTEPVTRGDPCARFATPRAAR